MMDDMMDDMKVIREALTLNDLPADGCECPVCTKRREALAALSRLERGGWISVKDRLPPENEWLVCSHMGQWPFTARRFGPMYLDPEALYRDPTHWMPLPAAPKEEPHE